MSPKRKFPLVFGKDAAAQSFSQYGTVWNSEHIVSRPSHLISSHFIKYICFQTNCFFLPLSFSGSLATLPQLGRIWGSKTPPQFAGERARCSKTTRGTIGTCLVMVHHQKEYSKPLWSTPKITPTFATLYYVLVVCWLLLGWSERAALTRIKFDGPYFESILHGSCERMRWFFSISFELWQRCSRWISCFLSGPSTSEASTNPTT